MILGLVLFCSALLCTIWYHIMAREGHLFGLIFIVLEAERQRGCVQLTHVRSVYPGTFRECAAIDLLPSHGETWL